MAKNPALHTRTVLGLTQAEFAQLLGVHAMTVSKWERNEANPTAYQLNLFEQFIEGAKQDAEVKNTLKAVLIGAGVAVALALLLRHLFSKTKN
jgi:putative transcriptional regulator